MRATGRQPSSLIRYAGWQNQAQKLLSLDRQYVKDLCRDHVWRYDHSPARQLERERSMQRTLDIAMDGKELTRQPERTYSHQHTHTLQRLHALVAALEQTDDIGPAGAGLRVKIFHEERDQEYDRGLSW